MRDVLNSEKHLRIVVERMNTKKMRRGGGSSGGSGRRFTSSSLAMISSHSSRGKALPKAEARRRTSSGSSSEYIRRACSAESFPVAESDQYYSKKKKRKTEQEKLIASLNETELSHVDGAFKRSTNIRYNNLNEDKLLDNLFYVRLGKAKRSSGKKIFTMCGPLETDQSEAMAGVEGGVEYEKKEEENVDGTEGENQEEKTESIVCQTEIKTTTRTTTETTTTPGENKKKRKTEKEKLIENLSPIERIHVDGAFKRTVNNSMSNRSGNKNNGTNNSGDVTDETETDNSFSSVRFVGLDGDIESLILERTANVST